MAARSRIGSSTLSTAPRCGPPLARGILPQVPHINSGNPRCLRLVPTRKGIGSFSCQVTQSDRDDPPPCSLGITPLHRFTCLSPTVRTSLAGQAPIFRPRDQQASGAVGSLQKKRISENGGQSREVNIRGERQPKHCSPTGRFFRPITCSICVNDLDPAQADPWSLQRQFLQGHVSNNA
jgi:hypothetical protein